MLDGFLALFSLRPVMSIVRDMVDVLVVAYGIYRILLAFRGTRAMQVGQGLGLVLLVYVLAERLGLVTLYTILDRVLASFLLLVVVIFQGDIRRTLMRVGNRAWFFRGSKAEEGNAVDAVIDAVGLLAKRRIGALIVFERDAALDAFVAQGTVLDAQVTRDLLYTVFLPGHESPLHDGAAIIRNARVWMAGTFLPLTSNLTLDHALGTRHRAALGISEETDAVVVVVSEERGEVSLCFSGNIVRRLNPQTLRQALYGLFYPKRTAVAILRDAVRASAPRTSRNPPGMTSSRVSIPPPPAVPRVSVVPEPAVVSDEASEATAETSITRGES